MLTIACLICGLYIEVSGGYLATRAPTLNGFGCEISSNIWECDELAYGSGLEPFHGAIAIGLEWSPRAWLELTTEYRHESAPRVNDLGLNGAWVKARVFPFRRFR